MKLWHMCYRLLQAYNCLRRYYLNPVSWILYGTVTSQLGDVTSPFTDVRPLLRAHEYASQMRAAYIVLHSRPGQEAQSDQRAVHMHDAWWQDLLTNDVHRLRIASLF